MPIANGSTRQTITGTTKIDCQADTRVRSILEWLKSDVDVQARSISAVSGDASFRRYFRIIVADQSYVVMDAPPDRENIKTFVQVAGLLADAGVNVPEIIAADWSRGFLLLGDLGDKSYLDELDKTTVKDLYRDALDTLLLFQQGVDIKTAGLPEYDEALLTREVGLFSDWFLQKKLGLTVDEKKRAMIDAVQALLIDSALQQPHVCVHRDYHSRNLMVVDYCNPGVLDFQDAVIGPMTYDLVSLLRDCYIAWPESTVDKWLSAFHQRWIDLGLTLQYDQLVRWFDLMGMQRHMKAVGIFSRLDIRDGKPGYLADIPRTLSYISLVSQKYTELNGFAGFLESEIMPAIEDRLRLT